MRGHRLLLERRIEYGGLALAPPAPLRVNVTLCNPSVAGELEGEDPTSLKVRGFCIRASATEYSMTNLITRCSTNPALLRLGDLNDPEADRALAREFQVSDRVVAAWGSGSGLRPEVRDEFLRRAATVRSLADDLGVTLWCLGTNKDGSPKHPLYVPYPPGTCLRWEDIFQVWHEPEREA